MQESKGYHPAPPEDHTSPVGSYHSQIRYSYHSNDGDDLGTQKLPPSPSPFSHQPSFGAESDMLDHPPPPHSTTPPPHQHSLRRSYYAPSFTHPGRILALQAVTTLSTIIFTVLPVIIKAGDHKSWGHWYSWKDLVRLLEPFVSGLFHCWFFYSADLMQGSTWSTTETTTSTTSAKHHPASSAAAASAPAATAMRRGSLPVGLNSYLPTDEFAMAQYVHDQNNHPIVQHHRKSTSSQYSYHAAAAAAAAGGSGSGGSPHDPTMSVVDDEDPYLRPPPKSIRHTPAFRSGLSVVFTFFLMTYVTGASLHTAAAFFKSTIEFFLDNRSQGIGLSKHPLTTGDGSLSLALAQELKQGYVLMQDTWEHLISHYIYAFGALGMTWCQIIAYADQTLPRGVNLARVGVSWRSGPRSGLGVLAGRHKSSKRLVPLYFVTGILYGGILAGVSCQYPKGIYIGYAYTVVMMLAIAGYILTKDRGRLDGLLSLGRYYILQTYLIGGVVALVAITGYLAINNFDFLTSNDKSHIGTHSRP
ncbi:hypothetical protein DFQ26_001428 [Actinomortierella ambigua]|nr:hypothetical protein DFQ26_001428 [Actinomortierella ambigua]